MTDRDERFGEPTKTVCCIKCNKHLRSIDPSTNHPAEAVVFRGYGQYGSTQFDPGDGSFLEINLCDGCLMEVAETHVVSFPPERNKG